MAVSEQEAQVVKVLVYSDDSATRKQVIDAVGRRAAFDLPKIEWIESATGAGIIEKFTQQRPALLILDGEAAKEGGFSLCRKLHVENDVLPPIAIICARPQDHWLANWAHADAVIDEPLEPRKVQIVVEKLLRATVNSI